MLFVSDPRPNRLWKRQSCRTILHSTCVLQPHSIFTLKSWSRLLMALIFELPQVTRRLLKISITMQMECAGFSLGACPYISSLHRASTKALTCLAVALSAWASSRAVTSRLWFCLQYKFCRDTLLIIVMISWKEGHVRDINLLDPQSNWQDWALNRHRASDLAQLEPWMAELGRCLCWSWWSLQLLLLLFTGWTVAKTLVPPWKKLFVKSFMKIISSLVALLPLPPFPPILEG